jgi:hypothetical protein
MSRACLNDVLRENRLTYVAALMEMGLTRDEAFQRLKLKQFSSLAIVLSSAERRFQSLVSASRVGVGCVTEVYLLLPHLRDPPCSSRHTLWK